MADSKLVLGGVAYSRFEFPIASWCPAASGNRHSPWKPCPAARVQRALCLGSRWP